MLAHELQLGAHRLREHHALLEDLELRDNLVEILVDNLAVQRRCASACRRCIFTSVLVGGEDSQCAFDRCFRRREPGLDGAHLFDDAAASAVDTATELAIWECSEN